MVSKDAYLLALSAPSISAKTLRQIELRAGKASDLPLRLVRLEEEGPSVFEALDALRADHCRTIHVVPIGFPFPENLLVWLPGILASWSERPENAGIELTLARESNKNPELIEHIVQKSISQAELGKDIKVVKPSLGKPGWNNPPDFDFHLLVCVGPRCQIHGSSPFLQLLQGAIRRAGLQNRCLITRTGCIYPCNKGPVLVLYPHGDWYQLADEQSLSRFVKEVLGQGLRLPEFIFHRARLADAPDTFTSSHNEMEITQ